MRRYQSAIAQHRDAIGNARDLVEAVADIDEADAVRLQPGNLDRKSVV